MSGLSSTTDNNTPPPPTSQPNTTDSPTLESRTGPVHNYRLTRAGIWWYTCRCSNPSSHLDEEFITDPVDIVGANFALDLAGKDVMDRKMLWEVCEKSWPDNEQLMEEVNRERNTFAWFQDHF